MAEGFIERSDLSKALEDARAAGYNSGYTAGKNQASGVGGVSATGQGVQSYSGEETTLSNSDGSYGWNNWTLASFPLPNAYVSGKTAAVCHIFNVSLYVISSTGKSYNVGYWYDDDNGRPITVQTISIPAGTTNQSFTINPAVITLAAGRYNTGLRFHGTNGKATTVCRLSCKYQWYLFGLS